ncbi:MAG: lysophospholipid acyltransferase family protein [Actinomycetota bacterium]
MTRSCRPDARTASSTTTGYGPSSGCCRTPSERAGARRMADRPASDPLDQVLGLLGEAARSVFGPGADDRLVEALALLRRRLTGDYEVDLFGFDAELTETVLLPLLRPLYRYWFRVDTRGVENIPGDGAALVVANHSGTIPLDSLMTQVAVHDEHPNNRHLRMLGADLVFRLPVVADVARKSGTTLACNEDAERLLGSGHLVGVWPEGYKGIGKPFRERYQLRRFGRGGFVSAAIRAGAPIVPCSIVGAEEIYPMLGNIEPLARLFGLPYLPVTPTFPWLGPLGAVPLPSKWIIQFGEQVGTDEYGSAAAEDPMLVFDLTNQVRETIQETLDALVAERGDAFS